MDKYIVTRDEIDSYAGVAGTHFLNPNCKRINKSLGDLTGLTGLGFHLVEVEPGHDSVELHEHYHEDECVYVLEGVAEARIGEATYRVGSGDFIGYRAGGEPHQLRNIGEGTLRYIVAGQRLDHDVIDYPAQNKRLFRNHGIGRNLVDLEHVEEAGDGQP